MTTTYLTEGRIDRLSRQLSDRDWSVLHTLRCVRVATADQLERLHFTGVGRRRTRSALASLAARDLLARLPRIVGGTRAGSSGFVYVLGPVGQRLMYLGLRRTRRPWTVGTPFLTHSLAVTQLLVTITEACRETGGEIAVVDFRGEPDCWRTFMIGLALKPDAEAVLSQGPYEDRWLFEVDLGTESPATLDRKLARYVAYWRTGFEQNLRDVFPRVLWIVPDDARQQVLGDAIARTPAEAQAIFAVTTSGEAAGRVIEGADL